MSEVWSYCVASTAEIEAAVRARFAQGPFVEVADPAQAYRTVELDDAIVREVGADLDNTLLPARLATATREPVVADMGGWTTRWLPDGSSDTIAELPRPAAWRPSRVLHFALDREKQRREDDDLERELPGFIMSTMFPIRARLARLDCKQAQIYSFASDTRRHYVSAELWLAIYAPTADGNDRELVELRKETVALCNFRVLELDKPLDERNAAYFSMLRRWKRTLTEQLNATTSWASITPTSLIEG